VKIEAQGGKFTAEKVFANKEVQNRDGGVVLVGDNLFGHSESRGWICSEFKSGKILWSDKEVFGRGSVSCADGRLYCCAEKGGVIALIEPSTQGWQEKGRLELPQESRQRRPLGGLWTHPVVANGRLYIRDQEMLHCYDVKR
jgi:hypothetical protein